MAYGIHNIEELSNKEKDAVLSAILKNVPIYITAKDHHDGGRAINLKIYCGTDDEHEQNLDLY